MLEPIRFTESVDLDLDNECWSCNRCRRTLGSARDTYKRGCLVYERNPTEIHPPLIEGEYTFSPDPDWVSILEFYCPQCGVQIETEYLPPGHPITVDIEVDLDRLKQRFESGELVLQDGRLQLATDQQESAR